MEATKTAPDTEDETTLFFGNKQEEKEEDSKHTGHQDHEPVTLDAARQLMSEMTAQLMSGFDLGSFHADKPDRGINSG